METPYALTIGQVSRYIKELFSLDDLLNDLWVRGEVSGFTRHTSGHLYFTLKDADCQLKCVMWRDAASRLRFPVEQGVQVLAFGSIGVYEKQGVYQLYVERMQPDGQGALHLAYERLKARLQAEGLFDEERKRPLPYLPRRVALVTSPTGAALQDLLRILRERHPRLDIVLVPALVQGDLAPQSLEQGLEAAAALERVDVVVLARGGGSLEDLWAFNDERVVRAIHRCPVPVVSAVGHETDFTLSDFAADCRCATPSAAAQTVAPDWFALCGRVGELWERAAFHARRTVVEERERLRCVLERSALEDPRKLIDPRREAADQLCARLREAAQSLLGERKQECLNLLGRLDALSPLATLARGYGVFTRSGNGRGPVSSVADVEVGDRGELRLYDGKLDCEVVGKESVEWGTE